VHGADNAVGARVFLEWLASPAAEPINASFGYANATP